MKPNLNQNVPFKLDLANVDTTLATILDSSGLASENMVISPRILLSDQIPLSKSVSTESGASDALRNLLSTDEDFASDIANLSTTYEKLQRSTSSTSDVPLTVLENPSFIIDRTAGNPPEAIIVNENIDAYAGPNGQSSILELSTTSTLNQENDNLDTFHEPDGFSDTSELQRSLSEELSPCSKNNVSWKSIPTLDLTPTVLNDVTTPNISNSSISSPVKHPEVEIENLTESESTERILLDAGYAITEIKDMMTLKKKHEQSGQVTYEKNRPQTHVFSQIKVYTYD